MSKTRFAWVAVSFMAVVGSAMAAVAMMDGHYTLAEILMAFGRTLIIVSTIMAVGVVLAQRNMTQDEAFEAGFRVGYRKGRRRAGLTVVPFRSDDERSAAG